MTPRSLLALVQLYFQYLYGIYYLLYLYGINYKYHLMLRQQLRLLMQVAGIHNFTSKGRVPWLDESGQDTFPLSVRKDYILLRSLSFIKE